MWLAASWEVLVAPKRCIKVTWIASTELLGACFVTLRCLVPSIRSTFLVHSRQSWEQKRKAKPATLRNRPLVSLLAARLEIRFFYVLAFRIIIINFLMQKTHHCGTIAESFEQLNMKTEQTPLYLIVVYE